MKSHQETFDVVVAHFLTMKEPSAIPSEHGVKCQYRGPNGSKCFAGILIPDERYSPDMENRVADSNMVGTILNELGYDIELVTNLQTCHDSPAAAGLRNGDWVKRVNERLINLAANNGLDASKLTA